MMYNEAKLFIIIALSVLLAGGILGYTYNRMEDFIHGPRIAIDSPHNGATVDEALITIEGRAENTSKIALNDRAIFVDEEGRISEELFVSYGYNKITLTAQDRFGRSAERVLEIVYK